MKAHKLSTLTIEEYLQLEIESAQKYEYHGGKVYALAGGTINHALLCGNIYTEIRKGLEAKASNCTPFTSEAKCYIRKADKKNVFVYPDAMVICGDIVPSDEDNNSITNPILIVEVLSKSTSGYDRGDKFHLYRSLQSFREYVLIEQERQVVDVHFKPANSDLWKIIRYENMDDIIKFESIDIEISMRKLYANLNLDPS